MKNKDRERLKTVYRVIALVVAVVMILGIIFQSYLW